MKNKKLAVIAFMLIAVLTIGFGYAALTDILTIKGSAEVTAAGAETGFDEKIYFTAATVTQGVTENSSFIDTASITNDKDIANFSANSLNSSDDVVVFTFTVTNASDHDATIGVRVGTAESANPTQSANYFDISYDVPSSVVAKKGGEVDITVTIRLEDGVTPPTDPANKMTANFVCELLASTSD